MQKFACCYFASTFLKKLSHVYVYIYIFYFFHTPQDKSLYLTVKLQIRRKKRNPHVAFSEKKIIGLEPMNCDCSNSLWIFRNWGISHGPHVTLGTQNANFFAPERGYTKELQSVFSSERWPDITRHSFKT